ncbi:hypothetical protein [Gallaecimonas sp. GXIMD4217]|uniref:hypothetical protein n=1 Tax=Gallaecimonas sp. GXIMD4217 TaxID=3131927 RepID=UPI00311B1A30
MKLHQYRLYLLARKEIRNGRLLQVAIFGVAGGLFLAYVSFNGGMLLGFVGFFVAHRRMMRRIHTIPCPACGAPYGVHLGYWGQIKVPEWCQSCQ